MKTITLRRAEYVSAEDHLERLFTELFGEDFQPDLTRLNELVESGVIALYLADFEENGVVGMVTVIGCRTASKDKLYIEDFVVLKEFRGMDIGRELLIFAMEDAQKLFGPWTFWLTSRPSRVAARELYKSLGFEEYETGVFRRSSCQARG